MEPDAHLVLGTLLQLVDNDECIGHYRELHYADASSHQLWNNLGLLSHQKGKRLAALACCRRASYLNPLDHVSGLLSDFNAVLDGMVELDHTVFNQRTNLLGSEFDQHLTCASQRLFLLRHIWPGSSVTRSGRKRQKSILKGFKIAEN